MWCRNPRSRTRWLIRLTVVGTGVWSASFVSAGLYECRDESGASIYTDSPAQLNRCQPVTRSGTSRLGLVGGTHPSSPPAPSVVAPEPITAFPPSAAPSPMTPDSGSSAIAPTRGLVPSSAYPGLVNGSSEGQPCIPGINPLNPLGGPPCPITPQTSAPPVALPTQASPNLQP